MMRFLDRFLDRKLGKAMMLLTSGSILGQVALILSAPILARLFSPAEFGILAVFVSLSSIISVTATCRLEYAIPVVEEDEAVYLSVGGLVVALGNTAVLAVIAWHFAPWLDAQVPGYQITEMAWLLALMPMLYLLPGLLMHWNLRVDGFAAISRARMSIGVTQAILQVSAGFLGFGVMGLVLGYMLGFVVQSLYLFISLPRAVREVIQSTWRGFRFNVFGANRDYILFNASSSALQILSQQTPPIIIAALYGPAISGFFALGQRVVGMPVRMLAQSAAQVFMSQFKDAEPNALRKLFRQFTVLFGILALLGAIPLVLFAPGMFSLVFGENWRTAGEIVQWLTPVFVARFIAMPVAQALNIMNAQKWHLITSVMGIAVVIISFGLAAIFDWAYLKPVILFSIGTAATFALLWFQTFKTIKHHAKV